MKFVSAFLFPLFIFSFSAVLANGVEEYTIWKEKPAVIDGYSFQIVSGGDEFALRVSKNEYKREIPFVLNKETSVIFPEHFVTITPEFFCELPPVHLVAKINFKKRERKIGCSVREGIFLNQKALFIENEFIYLTILPELGGRIIETGLQTDRENYFYVNNDAVSSYHYSEGWIDLGGWEDNNGGWCGSWWNKKYSYEIFKNTPSVATVLLCAEHGGFVLTRKIIIRKGSTSVEVKINLKNKSSNILKTGLGIHPEFAIGGSVDVNDIFFWKDISGIHTHSYTAANNVFSAGNFTGFAGIIDTSTLHSIIFEFQNPLDVSFFQGGEYYNLEFSTGRIECPEEINTDYEIYLLHGIPVPDFFQSGIAGNIKIGKLFLKSNETAEIIVSLSSSYLFKGSFSLFQKKPVSQIIEKQDLEIKPLEKKIIKCRWNSGNLPDGSYPLAIVLKNKKGDIKVKKEFHLKVIANKYKDMKAKLENISKKLDSLLKQNKVNKNILIKAYFYLEKARSACEKGNEEIFNKEVKKVKEILKETRRQK